MSTIKQIVGTYNTLTVTGLNTLANDTYVASNSIDFTTNDPLDALVEVEATPGTVSGTPQLNIFAQASRDGTNWGTGPTSGTSATDEPVLHFVGALPLPTSSTQQRKTFSLAAAFGGVLPPFVRLVFRNRSGAALSAATVRYAEVLGDVT